MSVWVFKSTFAWVQSVGTKILLDPPLGYYESRYGCPLSHNYHLGWTKIDVNCSFEEY